MVGVFGIKAAAYCQEQGDSRHHLRCKGVHHRLARDEHLRFGVQHRQIARKTCSISLLGQLVGGFVGLECLLLMPPLACQGIDWYRPIPS